MPKILINEKDNTSPGTPGSYANYSVLIAGYMGRTPVLTEDATEAVPADKIQPDSNGVYEFSSKQDFEDTIGFSDAEKKAGYADITTDVVGEAHYGKRMAHALLNMGYTVIYVPIKSVLEANGLTTETFWELFKDKASYDFRFISHGLLELGTSYDEAEYNKLLARLDAVKADVKKFAEITSATAYEEIAGTTADDGHMWFADPDAGNGDQYAPYGYDAAKEMFTVDAETKVAPAETEALNDIAKEDAKCVTPGVVNNVNSIIAKLASYRSDDTAAIPGRGDCVALIELYDECYVKSEKSKKPETLIIEGIQRVAAAIDAEANGAYCAMTVPSVHYKMSEGTAKFPGSFHYLACFMGSLRAGFAEWYAAAGYTRGVSSYTIDHTSVKLGEIAINALEPRYIVDQSTQPTFACNVIANFRGSYYLWGNRTAYKLKEEKAGGDLVAHHFLNIRQLCTTIKKQLYVACRRFTFDPNSDTLWFNFVNAITPTLDLMKADQGIRDYKVLKVFTDKKATLKAKIRIIPIEAVEDFDIEVSLEDSFGGVSVAAN